MKMFQSSVWFEDLPSDEMDVCDEYLYLFFKTMLERQLIWKRRFVDKKEKPWTNDKILRDNKFTNVYRELDRNSQWQIKNILLDSELSLKNLIWKLMVFRIFNNPSTFEFQADQHNIQLSLFDNVVKSGLIQPNDRNNLISATDWRNGIPDYDEYDKDEFTKFIAGVRACGLNPYTNAYLINSQATPDKSRDYCYTRLVIPTLHEKIPQIIKVAMTAKNPEELIEVFESLPSVSNFVSHEYFQDFTYIERYTNRVFMKFNQNDYTNVGPGAAIGIRLIFPSYENRKEQKQGIYRLRDMAPEMLEKVSRNYEKFPFLEYDKRKHEYYLTNECNITLHQIEMWLCEFQKYWKMMIGKGKQRSKFIPRTI